MSEPDSGNGISVLSMSSRIRLEAICESFESSWDPNRPNQIADALVGVTTADRPFFVRELILLDVALRRGRGLPCDFADYLARFPDLDRAGLAQATGALDETQQFVNTPARAAHDNTVTVPELEPGAAAGRSPIVGPEGYEILEEIGSGGMGIVYRARQRGTEQLVALKMLRRGALAAATDSPGRTAELFRNEARAAARLRHSNRVRILHLGEHAGQPYYAMELIEGVSLAARIKQAPGISKEAAIRYVAGVAEAVHEAHQHGVLHRDIKPHNILIDERTDEALLTDFGLARLMDAGAATTVNGTDTAALMVGTPLYMSPEHTRGADQVIAASDTYSLGATLYELLTGQPPFRGKEMTEVIKKVRHEKAVPPRQHRRDISRRVEQICLKCLEKDPTQRYRSAQDLAQALRGYLREVHHAGRFAAMGTLFIGLAPVTFLIMLTVYLLLQTGFFEPLVWLVVFSMYPALFAVFLLAPPKDDARDAYLSRRELWSIWTGKLCAAVCISIALRLAIPDARQAILMSYPVFAALSGMAVFVMVSKMPWPLFFLAAGCWLIAIVMVLHLEWSPIYYGLYSAAGLIALGGYLRRLGMELR